MTSYGLKSHQRWRRLTLSGGVGVGVWTPQNTPQEIRQRRTVTLTLQSFGGELSVQVKNTWWPDGSSPPQSNQFKYTFERQS